VGGDADALREATRDHRAKTAEVVREVGRVLEEVGIRPSQGHLRQATELLHAAAAEARSDLVSGRLLGSVEVEDPFAGLSDTHLPPAPARGRTARTERGRGERVRAEREAAVSAARDRVKALEETARQARVHAHRAEAAAASAQREADQARREADAAEARAAEAREALGAAGGAAEGVTGGVTGAAGAVPLSPSPRRR
jgi:hypothetical protein